MISAGYSDSNRNDLRTCFDAPMSPSRECQIGVVRQREGFEKIGRRRANMRVPFWDDVSGVRKKSGGPNSPDFRQLWIFADEELIEVR